MTELKIGDKVAMGREFGSGTDLFTIIKETPTMFVCNGGTRFRKDSLKIVGSGKWGPFSVRVPTDQDVMNCRIAKAQKALRSLVVTEANLEMVEVAIRT